VEKKYINHISGHLPKAACL